VSKCGFLWGRTGIYAVTAVVRDRSNNQAGVQSLVDLLQEVFQASVNDDYCPYDDWDRCSGLLSFCSEFVCWLFIVPGLKSYAEMCC